MGTDLESVGAAPLIERLRLALQGDDDSRIADCVKQTLMRVCRDGPFSVVVMTCGPGQGTPLDHHVLANALPDRPSITLHVDGGDMNRCNLFQPDPDGWWRREPRALSYDN